MVQTTELLRSDAGARSRANPAFRETESRAVDKIFYAMLLAKLDMLRSVETACCRVGVAKELLHADTVDWLCTLATPQCTQCCLVDQVLLCQA